MVLTSNPPLLSVLTDNPAWPELVAILSATNDELMLAQVQSLLDIRNVSTVDDMFVVLNSLRMLGVNVSAGVLRKQAKRLAAGIDTLQTYYKVAGTGYWDAWAAFIIDDVFNVTRLWTSDYRSFYREPRGTTLADGGTWYPTTHMELEVGAGAILSGIDLTISYEIVPEIAALLVEAGVFNEEDATQWATRHVGLQLNNVEMQDALVRHYIFTKRMTEFFYQWAPIEDVLESIIIVTSARTTVRFGGKLIVEPNVYNQVGSPTVDVSASGFRYSDTYLRPNQRFSFYHLTSYFNGQQKVDTATIETQQPISEQGDGWVVFEPTAFNTTINVVLRFGDKKQTVQLRLQSSVSPVDPVSLQIYPSRNPAYAGQAIKWRAIATYPSGSSIDITEESGYLHWESNPVREFNGAQLVLPDSIEDYPLAVTCKYIGVNRELEAKYNMTILRSLSERVAVKLMLHVPDVVKQGVNTPVTATAIFNDGTTEIVEPNWYWSNQHARVQDGVLVTGVMRRDYWTIVGASYASGGGPVLTAQVNVKAVGQRWMAQQARVRCPDLIEERTEVFPEAQLYIVDMDAPEEEVLAGNPKYVLGWRPADLCTWFGQASDTFGALNPNPKTGQFVAPVVGDDSDFAVGFTALFNGVPISATKVVRVFNRLLIPAYLSTKAAGFLASKSSTTLTTFVRWNNGKLTGGKADYSVEFVPSPTAQQEAVQATLDEIKRLLALGQDASHLDPDNPDYMSMMKLEFRNTQNTDIDVVKGVTFPLQQLVYEGTLHGMAYVTATYEHNGVPVSTRIPISLSPTRKRVIRISLEAPPYVGERTRTFVRALAEYDDQSTEYVPADWFADWYEQDQYTSLIVFSTKKWSGLDLVRVLENKEPATFEEFLSMRSSRLSVFAGVTDMASLTALEAEGALMQVDSTHEAKMARISARYYGSKATADITVSPAVPEPINTIVNHYILGPIEVQADVQYASYALVNVYELTGSQVLLDGTEVETGPSQYEMEVSSDWVIMRHEELVDDAYVLASRPLATVDGDGYMQVSRNVEGRVLLRAVFDDNYQSFSNEIWVSIHKVNTYLVSLDIVGQVDVFDDPALNPSVEYKDGVWYIPQGLILSTLDAPDGFRVPSGEAMWSIVGPLQLTGVSIGERDGRLYVTTQDSDAVLDVKATLTWPLPEEPGVENRFESITGRKTLVIKAARAITEAWIDFGQGNIDPDTDIQMVMKYERRNGDTGDSLHPVGSIGFEWSLRTPLPPNVTLSADGVLRFRPSNVEQVATVQCILTEDRTKITESIVVRCPGVGYPTKLDIVGFSNVRDDAVMNFKALATRAARPSTDETRNSLWSLRNEFGDTITVSGVSISPATGVLTVDKLSQDVTVYVHCLFIENLIRLEKTVPLNIACSIPRYGVAEFGINSLAQIKQQLKQRLNSFEGGAFVIDARQDQFGYFCCREDYGQAIITAAALPNGSVNNNYEGWDGAAWTLSDFSKVGPIYVSVVYDNVTERLALYRTNKRAGLLGKFSVKYLKP